MSTILTKLGQYLRENALDTSLNNISQDGVAYLQSLLGGGGSGGASIDIFELYADLPNNGTIDEDRIVYVRERNNLFIYTYDTLLDVYNWISIKEFGYSDIRNEEYTLTNESLPIDDGNGSTPYFSNSIFTLTLPAFELDLPNIILEPKILELDIYNSLGEKIIPYETLKNVVTDSLTSNKILMLTFNFYENNVTLVDDVFVVVSYNYNIFAEPPTTCFDLSTTESSDDVQFSEELFASVDRTTAQPVVTAIEPYFLFDVNQVFPNLYPDSPTERNIAGVGIGGTPFDNLSVPKVFINVTVLFTALEPSNEEIIVVVNDNTNISQNVFPVFPDIESNTTTVTLEISLYQSGQPNSGDGIIMYMVGSSNLPVLTINSICYQNDQGLIINPPSEEK